jgi:Bacteriocin-protection, YdeI or OmpD-Associated
MSNLSVFEKLQIKDEKSMLIQGLPSSIEKMFAKLSYAKSVTPLLKSRKVDFVLIFAINQSQLINIMKEVMPALSMESKLWIAYPKVTSKIVSDLNRESSWDFFTQQSYEGISLVDIDHMWSAIRFKKDENAIAEPIKVIAQKPIAEKPKDGERKLAIATPVELDKILVKHREAKNIFSSLSTLHQREYVSWIQSPKTAETKKRRLESVVEKLMAGKKTPLEK